MQTLNIGFNIAKYDRHANYIMVLDDDCILQEVNSISKMVETINSKSNVGMVGCNIIGPNNTNPQTDFKCAMNKPVNIGKLPTKPFRIYDYVGACALYDSNIFNGYDESFNIYWNEADTALNILSRGYEVLFESSISPIHLYSPKQRNLMKGIYYYIKNGNTIINRYLSFKNRLLLISIRLFFMFKWVIPSKNIKLIAKSTFATIYALIQIFYMKDRCNIDDPILQDEINQVYTSWYFRKFYEWLFGYPIYVTVEDDT
jgi:GT2 family glycosyltransferase